MISKGNYKGVESIVIENDYLRAEFLPVYGSKMASLINKKTGREFLFQQENTKSLKIPSYGAAFNLYDSSGFDECFPSIDATMYPEGKYRGVEIPDHGEVWALPWNLKIDKENEILEFEVNSPKLPYKLTKKIKLNKNKIESDYTVYNLNKDEELKFIWTPHLLIKCDENMKINVPDILKTIMSVEKSTEHLGDWGTIHNYPVIESVKTLSDIDMSKVEPVTANNCEKFYFLEKMQGDATCGVECLLTGEKMTYKYDTEMIPYLGVWKTQGGYRGDYNIALEPCTGVYDDLYVANSIGKVKSIAAGGKADWKFEIIIA